MWHTSYTFVDDVFRNCTLSKGRFGCLANFVITPMPRNSTGITWYQEVRDLDMLYLLTVSLKGSKVTSSAPDTGTSNAMWVMLAIAPSFYRTIGKSSMPFTPISCGSSFKFFRGRIHMILTNPLSNQEADTIFREYQEQSDSGQLKFRRWPLRAVCDVLSYAT